MRRPFDHLPMAYRMVIGFSVLILLLVIQFLLFDAQNQQLGSIHDRLVQHPFLVSRAALQAENKILEIQILSERLLAVQTSDQIQIIEQNLEQNRDALHKQLAIIQERFLGDLERVQETRNLLDGWWHSLYQHELHLIRENHPDQVVALRATPEYRQRLEQINQNINYIIQFAHDKALSLTRAFDRTTDHSRKTLLVLLAGIILFGLIVAILATRAITRPLAQMSAAVTHIADKNFALTVPGIERGDEFGLLARSIARLQEMARHTDEESWIKSQVNTLSTLLQQSADPTAFADHVLHHLTPQLNATLGACYFHDEEQGVLRLQAGYGLDSTDTLRDTIPLGETLVGLCARKGETLRIAELPDGYLTLTSSLGSSRLRTLLLVPLLFQERVLGVLEFAALQPFSPIHHALLESILPVIAINLESLNRLLHTWQLLHESQQQAQRLQQSREELETQSEELRSINEELQSQNEAMERHAEALRAAKLEAEQTAAELEQTSRYKSEFLANMSHELRTPLNSLLILARTLVTNPEKNLTDDQIESAQIIHDSGQDLLLLINDILDLAKVESGRMEVTHEPVLLTQLCANLERRFAPLARERGIGLHFRIAPATPRGWYTDPHKLTRILTNLLANAIKFTDQGSVTLTVDRIASQTPGEETPWLALAVEDTGTGIPLGQEERIFEAFQQVDGTTSRRHGGTGLGLTIARELSRLLGGQIRLTTTPGQGSTFTLLLPVIDPISGQEPPPAQPPVPARSDFRSNPTPPGSGNRTVLIIEDDPVFARILGDLTRKQEFTPLMALDGAQGLALARRHLPAGVILDLTLPDQDGLNILHQLKADPTTQALPVHIISARDEIARGMAEGAADYWVKPISQEHIQAVLQRIASSQGHLEPRHVLVIEDDPHARKAIGILLASSAVQTTCVASAEEAMAHLNTASFCCMILDLNLAGISGFELLEQACSQGMTLPPVIVYSGKMLTPAETLRLRQFTDHIILKGERAPERLQEEVALFLHQVKSGPTDPPPPAAIPPASQPPDPALHQKTILIVDDDMRNIFALSKALRSRGLQVLLAQDGKRALALLQEHPEIDLVLMDIMMPEMDGYAAIQAIRAREEWRRLPVLALTAKAMNGEREKCLQAGANDYLTKPVELEPLMTRIHHWVSQSP
ncbi:MAG: response regulator [Magnetococcales bacterium]|nr:response regulator [Magnetococcales bacterium]